MKKSLLVLFMSAIALCSSSQITPKYQGEIELGYSVGVGTFSSNRVILQTIQGAKIGDYFSAGFGLGINYYHELYSDVGSGELFVPIFLNMKGYIPMTEELTYFVSLDLGYGIGVTEGVSGWEGFLWSPSFGLRYHEFKFQLGYTSQRVSEYGFGFNMNAFQFKIGVMF